MAASIYFALFLAVVAHLSAGEQVAFYSCPEPDEGPANQWNCTVNEVRIVPCAEAAEDKPCKIKKGKSASIQVDFTSDLPSTTLIGKAFWSNALVDLPFVGMNTDACLNTQCPVPAGQRQTYVYDLTISKKFPVRTYDVKWRLFNEINLECCFLTKIKLVK